MTFAPSNHPPDAVVSAVTQSDSSSTSDAGKGSVKFIETDPDKNLEPDASAKTIILYPPPTGQYFLKVQFDDGLHDVASFFRKPTYRFEISADVLSNALRTMTSLLDTDVVHNLVNKDFLGQAWKESIKSSKSPQLRTGSREKVNIEGIVAEFIPMGDLRVRPWIGIVENLSVDVLLETSFID